MNALTNPTIDRRDFEFDHGTQQASMRLDGHTFEFIGGLRSKWNYFKPATETLPADGLLIQEGEISVVNPDKNSAVSFLLLIAGEHFHHFRNEFSFADVGGPGSSISIVIYPRDADTLVKDANYDFEKLIKANIPHAHFLKERTPDYCPLRGPYIPHTAFVTERIKPAVVAEWGLNVAVVSNRRTDIASVRAPLDELFTSPLLSCDPSIREGFKKLLGMLCNPGGAELLPRGKALLTHRPSTLDQK